MKEITEALYFIKYTQLKEEVSEIFKKLDIIFQEQGVYIFNPEFGLEKHYRNIQEIMKNNHKYIPKMDNEDIQLEPLYIKLHRNQFYSDTIKSNIVNTVDKFIPPDEDINERAKRREQLVLQWAKKIVEVTGHEIRTGKNLLNGKSDLDASVILAIEDVLPIDRNDILGERDSTEYAVLEILRKQMAKNYELKKAIDKVVSAFLRLLENIEEKNYSDLPDYVIPYLEKCIVNLKETRGGKIFTDFAD